MGGVSVDEISKSIVKADHGPKVRGEAVCAADHPMVGVLYGKPLRSDRARAKIRGVRLPALPAGYTVADRRDIPEQNGGANHRE